MKGGFKFRDLTLFERSTHKMTPREEVRNHYNMKVKIEKFHCNGRSKELLPLQPIRIENEDTKGFELSR